MILLSILFVLTYLSILNAFLISKPCARHHIHPLQVQLGLESLCNDIEALYQHKDGISEAIQSFQHHIQDLRDTISLSINEDAVEMSSSLSQTISPDEILPAVMSISMITQHIHPDSFDAIPSTYIFAQNQVLVGSILQKSMNKAFDGGLAGASAAAIQVLSLMWLRTAMNYQYRFGNGTIETIKLLYSQGGLPRLYQGLPFALVQGPLSRFGDTASNILLLSLLDSFDPTGTIPVFLRTGLGSVSAGIWRVIIMPIDTIKTCLQVYGSDGLTILKERLKSDGIPSLYYGSVASCGATIVGHYPWFLMYNLLSNTLLTSTELTQLAQTFQTTGVSEAIDPITSFSHSVIILLAALDSRLITLFRSAFIGLCASSVSDISSNSLRVLKTSKQTGDNIPRDDQQNYFDIAKNIVKENGIVGFLTRGLQTRLLVNALQGMLFSVLFKYFNADKR